jgi:hypothetical protein
VAEDLKNKPAYKCNAYRDMELGWKIVRDVSLGALHLRELRAEYLPFEPAEDFRDFSIRLARAIFFNAFERTLHGLAGMVFRKEPKLSKDVPEIIRGREAAETDQAEEIGILRDVVFALTGVEDATDDEVKRLARASGLADRYQKWKAENSSQDVSAKVEGWAENIDLQGNHWTVFAKEVFTDALRDGHSFIYLSTSICRRFFPTGRLWPTRPPWAGDLIG